MARKKDPVGTRALILKAAGLEFCELGITAARVNTIVERANVTKGCLFHHFSSKEDLALAWIKETLPPLLESAWLTPLSQIDISPIETLKKILQEQVRVIEQTPSSEFVGSPIATLAASVPHSEVLLAQEIQQLYGQWHEGIEASLTIGQKNRTIHSAIKASEEASLIIYMSIGLELLVKSSGAAAAVGFLRSAFAYLDTLRPA